VDHVCLQEQAKPYTCSALLRRIDWLVKNIPNLTGRPDPTRTISRFSRPDPTRPDPRMDPTRDQICFIRSVVSSISVCRIEFVPRRFDQVSYFPELSIFFDVIYRSLVTRIFSLVSSNGDFSISTVRGAYFTGNNSSIDNVTTVS
jgi:hypothetical protein